MKKSFIKKLTLFIVFILIIGVSRSTENAYAAEYDIDVLSNKQLSSITNDESLFIADSSITEALKGTINLDENTTVFCTTDAPSNVVSLITSRSSDYRIVPYSYTKLYRTTPVLGNTLVDFLTIKISGEVYIYTDGKVHLFSMTTQATPHQSGWQTSIETQGLLNTDGTLSKGISYVYCTKLDVEYKFLCNVFIQNNDTYPTLSIGQIY